MDNSLLRKIMKDIRVELTEEFDLNFERKAFSTENGLRSAQTINLRPGRC